jgi:hypothetical protein
MQLKDNGHEFGVRFCGLALLLAAGCSGNDTSVQGDNVAVERSALQFTHRVRVHVYTVRSGFQNSMITNALALANAEWAPVGIQFDFNSATDVSNPGLPASACDDGNLLAPVGDATKGKIAIFYCNSNWSGGGSNIVSWAGDLSLTHEIGHYFHLNHTHRECWVAEDEDMPTTSCDGQGAPWYSVENCIRKKVERSTLPPECPNLPTGIAIRDFLLDGDGLSDTGISLHLDPFVGDPCAPGYTVPLVVNLSNGTTNDYSFQPNTNNALGYFGCSPRTFSPQQIAIARDRLFRGNRQHLINKELVTWNSSFSDSNGWNQAKQYSTIAFPEVNGGNKKDVCGRGTDGIRCATSTGSAFTGNTLWNSTFSDAQGWGTVQYYSTIRYPDVNGGGLSDVCGRGPGGIVCALSNGSNAFTGTTTWLSNFSDANGWNKEMYYKTIDYPQINGAGGADICGRGGAGIYCATSNGSSFTNMGLWGAGFNDASGWDKSQYYSTIRYPNVDGGSRADVCGRGIKGIYCATSNGVAFMDFKLWNGDFNDTSGFNQPQYYSTISFPDLNGDGKADLCGRGIAGLYCALSNGSSFGSVTLWSDFFSDGNNWNQIHQYSTIQFPDLDTDGKADVCGRGSEGVYCAYSTGSTFTDLRLHSDTPRNANGGTQTSFFSTLKFAQIDSDSTLELCGKGAAGILCEK